MNIKEKVQIFEDSCKKILNKDVAELNKIIDSDIETQIKDEIHEYQIKEEFAYNKKIEKLEKEYNKQLYSLEMESKKEVLNKKKMIQKDLKKEVIEILKNFINDFKYKDFLFKKINETIQKLENTDNSVLGILNIDNYRFGEEITRKYNIKIKIIEDSYIGGCILEDEFAGIYMDNTIQNSINEKFDN